MKNEIGNRWFQKRRDAFKLKIINRTRYLLKHFRQSYRFVYSF